MISKLYTVHEIAGLIGLTPDAIRKRIERLQIVSVDFIRINNKNFVSLLYSEEQYQQIKNFQRKKYSEPVNISNVAPIFVVKSESLKNTFYAFSDTKERKFTTNENGFIIEAKLFNHVEKTMLEKLGYKF